MPTKLEDLFVSYKALSPSNFPVTQTVDESHPQFIGPTRRTRAQRILSTKYEDDGSGVSPDSEFSEMLDDDQSQPDDIKRFTTQLWAAWKDNAAPEEYQTPAMRPPWRGGPSGPVTPYNRGQLQSELEDLFSKAGISIRVTSGRRAAGQAGNAGSRSHHVPGNAADIVPDGQETFDTLRTKMLSNQDILQFFYENGLGVIDETTPEAMRRYGSTGAHFHIGPDQAATRTWREWLGAADQAAYLAPSERTGDPKKDWTRMMYNAYYKKLASHWGDQYENGQYQQIARYLTYLSALESGWGQKAKGYNFGGHTRNDEVLNYDTLDEFLNKQMETLSKWDYMPATSLQDFVDRLYKGKYKYNGHLSPDVYYGKIAGTVKTADSYLGFHKEGGKFALLRQRYEKSFS